MINITSAIEYVNKVNNGTILAYIASASEHHILDSEHRPHYHPDGYK